MQSCHLSIDLARQPLASTLTALGGGRSVYTGRTYCTYWSDARLCARVPSCFGQPGGRYFLDHLEQLTSRGSGGSVDAMQGCCALQVQMTAIRKARPLWQSCARAVACRNYDIISTRPPPTTQLSNRLVFCDLPTADLQLEASTPQPRHPVHPASSLQAATPLRCNKQVCPVAMRDCLA